MGLKQKAQEFIGIKKKTPEVKERLEQIGLSFIASQEMETRVADIKELYKLLHTPLTGKIPKAKMVCMETRIKKIDELLHINDIPRGRAGKNSWYAELAFAWEELGSITCVFIESQIRRIETYDKLQELEKIKNKPTRLQQIQRKKDSVFINMEHFYLRITQTYAKKVSDVSWFPEDVGFNWAAIIQNMQPGRGGIDLNKEATTL